MLVTGGRLSSTPETLGGAPGYYLSEEEYYSCWSGSWVVGCCFGCYGRCHWILLVAQGFEDQVFTGALHVIEGSRIAFNLLQRLWSAFVSAACLGKCHWQMLVLSCLC